MLGNVLRMDMKACAKMFLPVYLIAAVLTGLARLTKELFIGGENLLVSFSAGLSMFLYGLMLLALVVLPMVFMAIYFYRNFLTDEGYLTFTLPVKVSTLVISKQINGIIWTVLSVLVLLGAMFGMFSSEILEEWSSIAPQLGHVLRNLPEALEEAFGSDVSLVTCILIIATLVLEVVFVYSNLYASMALGQLYGKHKIVGSVLAYVVIQVAVSTLSGLASFGLMYVNSINLYLAYQVAVQLILGCVFIGLTIYMLKNKLNLD